MQGELSHQQVIHPAECKLDKLYGILAQVLLQVTWNNHRYMQWWWRWRRGGGGGGGEGGGEEVVERW